MRFCFHYYFDLVTYVTYMVTVIFLTIVSPQETHMKKT